MKLGFGPYLPQMLCGFGHTRLLAHLYYCFYYPGHISYLRKQNAKDLEPQ